MIEYYYFLVKPLSEKFVAFAKLDPFIADANFVNEPGEMWFEFGLTTEDALQKLKRSLSN